MKEYNLEKEFKKIHGAFKKVKEDYDHVLQRLHVLEKENIALFNKVNSKKETTTYIRSQETDRVYIGNSQSMKVHSQDCPYGKKVTPNNREFFDSVSEALKKKYKRCSCVTS